MSTPIPPHYREGERPREPKYPGRGGRNQGSRGRSPSQASYPQALPRRLLGGFKAVARLLSLYCSSIVPLLLLGVRSLAGR